MFFFLKKMFSQFSSFNIISKKLLLIFNVMEDIWIGITFIKMVVKRIIMCDIF